MTTWQTFVEESRKFFDANWGCPIFQLIETMDELYRTALIYAPFPNPGVEKDHLVQMAVSQAAAALVW